MAYNPQKHHRRSIRLPEYDYSQPGGYFITLVTWQRLNLFGEIKWGEMQLNPSGKVVKGCLQRLPGYFPIHLDEWVIMPNHMHMICIMDWSQNLATTHIQDDASPDDAGPLPHKPIGTQPGSIAAIVQELQVGNHAQSQPGAQITWRTCLAAELLRTYPAR